MKIISNERYNKLKDLEIWEETKRLRGYSINPPKICSIEELVKWVLKDRINVFLDIDDFVNPIKKKKGEIGKIFGKSIIIK